LRPAINLESVYNDVGPCQDWEVFFYSRNLFSATKVRCSNRSMEPFFSSTSHLFDPDPSQDHDSVQTPQRFVEAGCPIQKPVLATTTECAGLSCMRTLDQLRVVHLQVQHSVQPHRQLQCHGHLPERTTLPLRHLTVLATYRLSSLKLSRPPSSRSARPGDLSNAGSWKFQH
jgi:hypothetical protein